MIGAIIGAATGVAGSILGGNAAKKAAQRARRAIENQKRENEDWWRLKSNVDYTKSADNQYALQQGYKRMQSMMDRDAGTQAVMGGSEAAGAAAKQAQADAMAGVVAQVAANTAAQRRADEGQYLQTKRSLDNQLVGIDTAEAQANTQAASQAMSAGMNLATVDAKAMLDNGKGLFEGMFAKKKVENS